jgi:hypothetical protein
VEIEVYSRSAAFPAGNAKEALISAGFFASQREE